MFPLVETVASVLHASDVYHYSAICASSSASSTGCFFQKSSTLRKISTASYKETIVGKKHPFKYYKDDVLLEKEKYRKGVCGKPSLHFSFLFGTPSAPGLQAVCAPARKQL